MNISRVKCKPKVFKLVCRIRHTVCICFLNTCKKTNKLYDYLLCIMPMYREFQLTVLLSTASSLFLRWAVNWIELSISSNCTWSHVFITDADNTASIPMETVSLTTALTTTTVTTRCWWSIRKIARFLNFNKIKCLHGESFKFVTWRDREREEGTIKYYSCVIPIEQINTNLMWHRR